MPAGVLVAVSRGASELLCPVPLQASPPHEGQGEVQQEPQRQRQQVVAPRHPLRVVQGRPLAARQPDR